MGVGIVDWPDATVRYPNGPVLLCGQSVNHYVVYTPYSCCHYDGSGDLVVSTCRRGWGTSSGSRYIFDIISDRITISGFTEITPPDRERCYTTTSKPHPVLGTGASCCGLIFARLSGGSDSTTNIGHYTVFAGLRVGAYSRSHYVTTRNSVVATTYCHTRHSASISVDCHSPCYHYGTLVSSTCSRSWGTCNTAFVYPPLDPYPELPSSVTITGFTGYEITPSGRGSGYIYDHFC